MDIDIAKIANGKTKRSRVLVQLAVGLAVCLLLLTYWFKAAGSSADWKTVELRAATPSSFGVGEFIARSQRTTTSAETGTIRHIVRQPGEQVSAGDVLLILDSPMLHNELQSAEIQLRRVELEYEEMQASLVQELKDAEMETYNARIALQVEAADLKAHAELLEKQVVSSLRYAQVEAGYQQRLNQLNAAQQRYAFKEQHHQRRLRSFEERIRLERLNTERLRERVDALTVLSTEDGIVKNVFVQLGDSVQPGSRLAAVGPEQPDGIRLRFPQRDLPLIQKGTLLRMQASGEYFSGRVARIEPDLRDGYVVVEAQANELPASARADMSVRAELAIEKDVSALSVYAQEISLLPGESLALKIRRNGRVKTLQVNDIDRRGDWLVFAGTVQAGDEVLFLPDQ